MSAIAAMPLPTNKKHIVIYWYDKLLILILPRLSELAELIREVPSKIQPYWTFREELTVEDDIVLKGTWIVGPYNKCQATLQLIHEGHLGHGKCKLRITDTVYWPGLKKTA